MSTDAWVMYDLLGQARKLLCEQVRGCGVVQGSGGAG